MLVLSSCQPFLAGSGRVLFVELDDRLLVVPVDAGRRGPQWQGVVPWEKTSRCTGDPSRSLPASGWFTLEVPFPPPTEIPAAFSTETLKSCLACVFYIPLSNRYLILCLLRFDSYFLFHFVL